MLELSQGPLPFRSQLHVRSRLRPSPLGCRARGAPNAGGDRHLPDDDHDDDHDDDRERRGAGDRPGEQSAAETQEEARPGAESRARKESIEALQSTAGQGGFQIERPFLLFGRIE